MKIVFLTSSLNTGGAERVATTLVNAWSYRGDQVTLVPTFSGGGTPSYSVAGSVELIYLADVVNHHRRRRGKRYFSRIKALRHLILDRNPDVVVSFLPNVNVAALIATSFTHIPCVVGERSDPSMRSNSSILHCACSFLYKVADVVTVQTEAVSESIRHVYSGLLNVVVIPNPVPEELLEWDATSKTSGERKVLISLGRLVPEKQVGQLIEVFSQLAPMFPDWDFDIWGVGPERAALQAQIDTADLGARVRMRGLTETPWEVMSQADTFVMNSRYEGFPNALLEAMAVGLPCVAAACPSGPREISNDGRDALIFEPGDTEGLRLALMRLMADGDLRASLGRQARASVLSRYSIAAVLKRWDEIFAMVRRPRQ